MSSYFIRFFTFQDKKIPLGYSAIVVLMLSSVILWQANRLKAAERLHRTVVEQSNNCPPSEIIKYRMSDYRYAKPLLLSDILINGNDNDSKLNNIKSGINGIIDKEKSSGIIHTASVYLRELDSGGFISINDSESYHPASMAKVPMMMAILRQSEITAGFMNKQIYVDQLPLKDDHSRDQVFLSEKSIHIGKNYTVKELLYYMVAESDNNAAVLLYNLSDKKIFHQLFIDLGMPSPGSGSDQSLNYTLSVSEFSRFMRVLYNATYLYNQDADYALSLLTQSEFKDGILKALLPGVIAAHKFGEFGWVENGKPVRDYELHESAIIYINNDPVLLTIMTKGNNRKDLAPVIAEIAKYVYDQETKPAS